MPSSWTESNRLHSSNQREQAAQDALNEYREEQALDAEIDGIIIENYGQCPWEEVEHLYDSYRTRWTDCDSDETRYFDEIGDEY